MKPRKDEDFNGRTVSLPEGIYIVGYWFIWVKPILGISPNKSNPFIRDS